MTTLTPELSDISAFLRVDRLNRLLNDNHPQADSISILENWQEHDTLNAMFVVYQPGRSRCSLSVPLGYSLV